MALLEILEERHRRKSTIIISQIPVSTRHDLIGEPTIADAIMDRLVYNSHRIKLSGEPIREKNVWDRLIQNGHQEILLVRILLSC